ncbi:MAG: hypothetical protein JKX75_09125 [Gammaproteobacteria bacterium]|nr:hypothetical protein [Gammaproteobacteria bacterium]
MIITRIKEDSLRDMMLALGCIHSRSCNTNKCPTGITTQNPARYKALDIDDKSKRVVNYQNSTVKHLAELIATSGLKDIDELEPEHINRRVNGTQIKNYAELYPNIKSCCLLGCNNIPENWKTEWEKASAKHW